MGEAGDTQWPCISDPEDRPVQRRRTIVLCLVFSGLTALVYQLIWTRLLGFAFGTTTEAVSSVLAVFFGGLALGNLLAARWLTRVERPLRVYAWLELAIGAFALLSLPLLRNLDASWAWLGVPASPLGRAALRFVLAALVLLPPTIAMGATLPVVARALVSQDGSLGRWSAILYAANTAGAVLGAYLCGFWLIPELGLSRSVLVAGVVNLGVAGLVLLVAGSARAPAHPPEPVTAPEGDSSHGGTAFLIFFGISGFVAIGYEIVWSKIFGIVMEGTLYGFATVLSAYLLGIGLGSLLIAPRVDAIRDLPRAFGLLHLAIGASVVLGIATVPYLPWAYDRIGALAPSGDAVHLLWLIVLPIVLVPTALFGAAFPILIRIYARRARSVGRGMGVTTAVNTAGSIAASLIVGFWWIPSLGSDATLYALLVLDLGVALIVLGQFAGGPRPVRLGTLAGSAAVVATLALSFNGVRLESAIAGRQIDSEDLGEYTRGLALAAENRALTIEGVSSIVTVYSMPTARLLRTNGMPEAGYNYRPPHFPRESVSLGVWPYLAARQPRRALVIGLGGGNTLTTLLHTDLESIEVVELERGVARAVNLMHEGRTNPLDNPRVALRIDDGRNDLLLRTLDGTAGYDLITSQPSHPWRVGAANLFTEDFFRVARAALADGGVFASWLNGFRIDPESLLAVVTSFERAFPGSILVDIGGGSRGSFLLLGGREPITLDPEAMARRLAQPALSALLTPYGMVAVESVLAAIEGPARSFAEIDPTTSNTDDNAFVETRIPRVLTWKPLDYSAVESRLPDTAPVLPPLSGPVDMTKIAAALLTADPTMAPTRKLARLIAQHGDAMDAVAAATLTARAALRDPARQASGVAALEQLAEAHPSRPEPLRALGAHRLSAGDRRAASLAFEAAFARSGATRDALAAGEALHSLDPGTAWRWFERVPAEERGEHPQIAVYAALRGLALGESPASLAAYARAVDRYADTSKGRAMPGLHELRSRLAWAVGDASTARAHADADAKERRTRARPLIERAERKLGSGEASNAAALLERAALLSPSDEQVLSLRAEIAAARGDSDGLDRALGDLRAWAPSVEEGIAAENRFRTRHELPLLPETTPTAAPNG